MDSKFFLFGAALAALATFNSCTSDDEIVDSTIPEQPVEVKGEPISFTATINDGNLTRANVAGTLEGFTLWGVQNNAVSTTETGLAYAYDGDLEAWVNAGAPSYDTGDNPVPYYFYAMALGNTPIESTEEGYNARNNAAKANAITFGDDGVSTNTNGEIKIKGTYVQNKPLLLTGGNYDAKRFQYTMPVVGETSQIDLAEQEDLLVAHNFGTENLGWTTGSVPLTFQHIFSNIEINMALQQTPWSSDDDMFKPYENAGVYGVFAVIKSITIHGLKKTGTYTFGSGWSDPDNNCIIKKDFPEGLFIWGIILDTPEKTTPQEEENHQFTLDPTLRKAYEHQYYTPVLTKENSIMAIPQAFTSWTSGTDNCYIEIEGDIFYDAVAGVDSESGWTDESMNAIMTYIRDWNLFDNGTSTIDFEPTNNVVELTPLTGLNNNSTSFSKYYLPFKVKNNVMLPNKRYNFYIDLFSLKNSDGTQALDFYEPSN